MEGLEIKISLTDIEVLLDNSVVYKSEIVLSRDNPEGELLRLVFHAVSTYLLELGVTLEQLIEVIGFADGTS